MTTKLLATLFLALFIAGCSCQSSDYLGDGSACTSDDDDE